MTSDSQATHPAEGLPPARWAACFAAVFSALGLLWMPWVLLRQVDAFLAFQTAGELARDIALALVLLAVAAALLGVMAALASWIASRWLRPETARQVGWCVAVLPVSFLCIWQFGSAGWAWLKLVAGSSLVISATMRSAAGLALLVGGVLLWRLGFLARLLGRIVPLLLSLRGPALLLLALSVGWLAWQPPRTLATSAPALAMTPPAHTGPDVYLITLDTLAAEDAAVCGSGPTTMPRLRQLASHSTCFERHYASSNFTTPSTSTMETGLLPWTHWGVQIVAKMAPALREHTLAQQLREHGYEAHSISANLMASPRHHGSFATYDTEVISPSPALGLKPRVALSFFPDTTLPFWLSGLIPLLDTLDVHRFAEQSPFAPEYTYDAALPLIAQARRPQFLWLHTLPPHDPYLPPPSTKYKLLPAGELDRWSQLLGMTAYGPGDQALVDKHRLRYREAIMGADESLGRFLDTLDRQGKLENALIIVSSDHGESFERGYLGHAGDHLHDAVVRVPLVIKLPGQRQGRVVQTPVSLADLVPTILDVLDLPAMPGVDGRSLKPALLGEGLPPRPVFTMAMERQSRFRPLRAGRYAVIDGTDKLTLDLATGKVELHDLSRDPHEQQDLSAHFPDTARRLRALLDAELARAEHRRSERFDRP